MPEVIVELRGKTETWKLDRTRTVIGRSRAADIRIHHPSISGRHARIEWADGILRLVDAGSRHGIFLNGSKIDEVVLTDGLAVTIGKARLTFKTGGGQARAECLQWLQLPNPGRSGISPPPAPGSGLGTTPSDSEKVSGREASSAGTLPHDGAAALAPADSAPRPETFSESDERRTTPTRDGGSTGSTPIELADAPSSLAGVPLSTDCGDFLAPIHGHARPPLRTRRRTSLLELTTNAAAFLVSAGLHGFLGLILSVALYKQIVKAPDSPVTVTIREAKSPFVPPDRIFEGDGKGSPLGDVDFPSRKNFKAQPAAADAEPELAEFEGPSLADAPAANAATGRPVPADIPVSSGVGRRGAMRRIVKVELVPDDGTWRPKVPVAAAGGKKAPLDIKKTDDPAELVRGNMEDGREGGWKTIALMDPGELVVVTGEYDHVQRVLDKLKVRYTLSEHRKVGGLKLHDIRVMLLNCPGQLDAAGHEKVKTFVERGGWLISTDWALGVVRTCFPGYLEQSALSPETWVRIGPSEANKDDPLLRDVFNFTGENPKWYLEERSYLFSVNAKAQDKVKVLIESEEMKKKYGAGTVAVTFDHGRGHVLHIVSHLQQVSTDAKAHYAMYQLVANFLLKAATDSRDDKK